MKDNVKLLIESFRKYGYKSVYFRNLIIVTTIIIIPILVLSIVFFQVTSTIINQEVKNSNLNVLSKSMDGVDSEFKRIEDIFYLLSSNSDLVYLSTFEELNTLDYSIYSKVKGLIGAMTTAAVLDPRIEEFSIFFKKSDTILLNSSEFIKKNNYKYRDIITDMLEKNILNYKWIEVDNRSSIANDKVFATVYRIPTYNQENMMLLLVTIKERTINNIINMKSDKSEGDTESLILNSEGTILSHQYDKKIGSKLEDSVRSQISGEKGFFISMDGQERKAFSYVTSPYTGWKYLSITSLGFINKKIDSFKYSVLVITAALLIAAIVLSLYANVKIAEPINVLISLFNKSGDLYENHLSGVRFADVKGLGDNIVLSHKENIELRKKLEERIKLLKKAQFSALQYQINPHFLYNTIETINWSIREKLGLENEPSSLVESLSEFLRYSLEQSDNLVLLSDEINSLKNYLYIQKYRYSESFSVIYDIPDELLQYRVIKISLQPIVENSIAHGMKYLSQDGLIRISAQRVNQDISISIWDNGKGIENNKLNELIENLNNAEQQVGKRIGLNNVNLRYKTLFGSLYGIKVESEVDKWTKITLTFPAKL